MKRIAFTTFIVLFLQICLFASDKDQIQTFFEVYQDGKKQNVMLFFDLTIYKAKDIVKWRLNQMEFNNKGCKETTLLMRASRTDDNWESPLINNLKWISGQSFECDYLDLTNTPPILLKGKKNENGEWEIYGNGMVQIDGKMKKIEFKSKRNFKVKYKKISFF